MRTDGIGNHNVRNTSVSRLDCPYKPNSFIRDKQGEKPQMKIVDYNLPCKRHLRIKCKTCGFIKKITSIPTQPKSGKSTR